MPIMMAAAASHAPSLFQQEYRGWQWFYDKVKQGHPQPPETELENEELIAERVPRIQENFARLKREITAFDPDVIIAVLGDQREWFDGSNIPNVLVYSGPDEWTAHNTGAWDRDPAVDPWTSEEHRYTLPIDRELARSLSQGLVDEGFDAAWSTQMRQLAKPSCGFPHGIGFVAPHTHPSLSTPVVPVFVNVDNGPPVILNGERCVALGRAIAKICESSDKRILITGSGGMSHDPFGARSGWVDEPQDHWFLHQMRTGNVDALKSMFSFRSELFVGGAGELRTWIVAAAAIDYMKQGHRAAWSDYIPARKVTTGCGWVYYPPLTEDDLRARDVRPAELVTSA